MIERIAAGLRSRVIRRREKTYALKAVKTSKIFTSLLIIFAQILAGLSLQVVVAPVASAVANPLTVSQTLTSDVINQDTNYWPVGARVCNADTVAYPVTATFNWTTSSTTITLVGDNSQSLGSVAANGGCKDVYFQIWVPLSQNSSIAAGQSQTRKYTITFTTGPATNNSNNPWTVTTPSTRSIYIAPSVQVTSNLSVGAMTSTAPISSGVATVNIGSSYTFTVPAETGNGADVVSINAAFDPKIFQVISAVGTYASGTVNGFLNDKCTFDMITLRDCTVNASDLNETASLTYTVIIIGSGTQTGIPINVTAYYNGGDQWKFNGKNATGITSITAVWPLNLTVQGPGTVTNSATPSGNIVTALTSVTCTNATSPCTATGKYLTATTVVLTATPTAGQTFSGWGGACSSTSTTCTVLVSQITNVSATFGTGNWPLTVALIGAGTGTVSSGDSPQTINCADTGGIFTGTCSNSYPTSPSVKSITLTQVADPIMLFVSWGGACSGSASTCVVSMSEARLVTAEFAIDPQLDVFISANATNTHVVSSNDSPQTINCTSTATASVPNTTSGSCVGHYVLGAVITLTALVSPAPTWSVSSGGGGAGCTGAASYSCVVTLNTDTVVYVIYAGYPLTLTIKDDSTGSGYVTSADSLISNCGGLINPLCSTVYTSGASITLTRTADTGSTFTGWTVTGAIPTSGTCTSSSATCAFTSYSTVTQVTAQFSQDQTLSMNTTGTGSGTITGYSGASSFSGTSSQVYSTSPFTSVTLTANPASGSSFTGWSGGSCSGTSTCTVTMDQSSYVTATFTINTYAITVTQGSNGTISPGTTSVNYGSSQAFTFAPSTGYALSTVTVDGVALSGATTPTLASTISALSYTFSNVSATHTITATYSALTYTITYNNNNGTGSRAAGSYTTGGAVLTLADGTGFSKTGYTFGGWSTTQNNAATIITTYSTPASITVYAIWVGITNTVTYNNNGGIGSRDIGSYTTGGTALTLADGTGFSKTGYTFGGWSTTQNDASTIITTYSSSASISVYAIWTINSYTLTYTAGANGSISGTSPQTVNYGSSGSAVTATAASGYQFSNWSDGVLTATRTDTNVSSSISVTANFSALSNKTISYIAGTGGTISGSSFQSVSSGGNGTSVTAVPNAGYQFVKWSDNNSTTATRSETNVTNDVTTTASFSAISYTVTYDQQSGAGASGGDVTYSVVDSIVLPTTNPTRGGYTFLGWYAGASGGSSLSDPYSPPSPYGNVVIYAQWSAITYTITYDANTGAGSRAADSYTTGGAVLTLAGGTGFSKTGYTFGGWSTTQNDPSTIKTTYSSSASISVYAIWTANTLAITYDSQGGTSVSAGTSTTGGSISSAPTAPTKAGYSLSGWSTTSSGSLITYPYTHGQTVSFTLYAIWSTKTYTLTYYYNGATGGNSTASATYTTGSTAITLPTPTKTSYIFAGWYSEVALTNSIGGAGSAYSPSTVPTDIDAYAKWSSGYTITYAPAGGSSVTADSNNYANGATVTLPSAPSKAGYQFNGWSDGATTTAANATTYVLASAQAVAGVVTLTAQWISLPRNSLTYAANFPTGTGGTGTPPVDSNTYYEGQAVTLSGNSNLVYPSYSFLGWNTNSAASTNLASYTMGSTAVTMYAIWTMLSSYELSVTQIGSGGVSASLGSIVLNSAGTDTETYVSGTTVILTASPTTNWSVSSWSVSPSGAVTSGCTSSTTCTLQITAAITVTVTFAQIQRTLSLVQVGGGFVTSSDSLLSTTTSSLTASHTYNQGTSVTLHAVAGSGYTFTGWSSSGSTCSGTADCTTSNGANETFTATFTATSASSYSLSVSVTGNQGEVISTPSGVIACRATSGTCSASVTSGSSITLSIRMLTSGGFDGWGGACLSRGTASTCTLTMSSAKSVVAYFVAPEPVSIPTPTTSPTPTATPTATPTPTPTPTPKPTPTPIVVFNPAAKAVITTGTVPVATVVQNTNQSAIVKSITPITLANLTQRPNSSPSRSVGEGIVSVRVTGTGVTIKAQSYFSGVTSVAVNVKQSGVSKEVIIPVTVFPDAPKLSVFVPKSINETVVSWKLSPNVLSYDVKIKGELVCQTITSSCLAPVGAGPKTPIQIIANGGDNLKAFVVPAYQPNKPIPAITVNFATNSSVLNTAQKAELNKIAKYITEEGFMRLVVYGFTDSRGGVDNQALSVARAQSTADYLAKLAPGIDFVVAGFGASKPVASNKTDAGMAANRRAELSLW